MVKRIVSSVVLTVLAACQLATANPTLTAADAERIADKKARSFHDGLRGYEHLPAHYEPAEQSWWVAYRQKGSKIVEFGVRVEAKKKKAWLVLP